MKDDRDEPHTVIILLTCCYQTLETCSRFFLQIVEVVNSIELLL